MKLKMIIFINKHLNIRMNNKKTILLGLLLLAVVFSACAPRTYNWRLNVKDGENENNDGGFGRFNERGSPPLHRLDADFSYPMMNARIFTPEKYGIYVGGPNPVSYDFYGRQGHSEMRQKTWTIEQMKAAVEGGSVSGIYTKFDPRPLFYINVYGRTFRMETSGNVRITGHTRLSGKGNGNLDVKLFPDRTQKRGEFYVGTVILPDINK